MKYNLFLDDERLPDTVARYASSAELRKLYGNKEWVIVRNYPDFVSYIEKNGIPGLISFDHDLAEKMYLKHLANGEMKYNATDFEDPHNRTGYHCAKWLIDYCMDTKRILPEILVHSMNPVGKENIVSLFNSYKKASRLPGWNE